VELSPWAIQAIDKLRRAFLWKGTASVHGGHCMVAWPKCCRPAELGGLGIPDLKLMGLSLRLRWEWLRRTDETKTWTTLPAAPDALCSALFRVSITVQLGDGKKALFWTDNWVNGSSIEFLAPCLFAAVPAKAKRSMTVAQGLRNSSWTQDIKGALTVQVILEYLTIWEIVWSYQLLDGVSDSFLWRWSTDHQYSASSAYTAMFYGANCCAGGKAAP